MSTPLCECLVHAPAPCSLAGSCTHLMHVTAYVHALLCAWQGPLDLYLGLWSVPLYTVPTAFVYFCTYESLKGKLEQRGLPSAVAHLVPACAGAVLSAVVRVPGDTLKHRVQAYQYPNIFAVSSWGYCCAQRQGGGHMLHLSNCTTELLGCAAPCPVHTLTWLAVHP